MEHTQKRVIVVYEVEQIARVQEYLKQHSISLNACRIIALEFEVEEALRERNIRYTSLLEYVPVTEEFSDEIESGRTAARRFYEYPAMQFFSYRDINLAEVFEPILDLYLEYLGRYLYIFKRIAEREDIKKLYIPHSTYALPSGGSLFIQFTLRAAVDAAHVVGAQKSFSIETIGTPAYVASAQKKRQIARRLVVVALALYNNLIKLCIRPRPLKIYASEYWSHVRSFVERMDDVELIFMERKEIENIHWRQLLKHRIRFLHPSDAVNTTIRKHVSETMKVFRTQWQKTKENKEIQHIFTLAHGIEAWPIIERALTYLIETHSAATLVDAEGLQRIMKKERPDKILLRASISGQHHFFIAARIAQQLRIPSIELQHAGAAIDPHSVFSRLIASYLAGYGPLTRDLLVAMHGYAPERIRTIGSPRFDHYVRKRDALVVRREERLRALGLNPARPVVFVAVPHPGADPCLWSSYQVASFFQAFREAQQKMPSLQFIFKFRPGTLSSFYTKYVAKLFSEGGAVATDTSDFLPLIMASNIACTSNSTIRYEIMLGKRPLIFFPWKKYDTYELAVFKTVAPVAFDAKALANHIRQFLKPEEAIKAVARQDAFLSENYSFDGHAPERMAEFLRERLSPLS